MTLILSGTDGLSDVDGSAATPAIRGTDANTGIFFPAADTIAFSEGGVEAMRIDSSGNVGIGTASPSGRLHVTDATSGTTLRVTNTSSSSGNRALIRLESATSTFGSALFQTNGTDASYQTSALNLYAFDSQPLVFGTSNTERLRIDSSGSLTLAGAGFMYFGNANQFIRSAGAGGSQMIVGASSGGFYQQVGATYYLVTTAGGSTSDETLKKNIQPIQNALSKVCAITGITYEFIEEPMCDADKGAQIGVGAQTVETQFPEIVVTQEDGKKTVRYDRLVAPLIEAIKEQQALITALQADVAALQAPQGTP
jgi:hypothetical protein